MSKLKIVYVNSPARTGKDTFCDMCQEHIKCKTVSTVDYIKEISRREFDWDGVKDDRGRELLASLRYAAGKYNMGPIVRMGHIIKDSQDLDVLFIMVREFSEMDRMQQMYGGETLSVNRKVSICETEQKFLDEFPDDYKFDHIIQNRGSIEMLVINSEEWCNNLN